MQCLRVSDSDETSGIGVKEGFRVGLGRIFSEFLGGSKLRTQGQSIIGEGNMISTRKLEAVGRIEGYLAKKETKKVGI